MKASSICEASLHSGLMDMLDKEGEVIRCDIAIQERFAYRCPVLQAQLSVLA